MKLFLIDGHALIFKMYYAFLGRPMVNSRGVDTSILFGFTKYILELLHREKPTHSAVSFDPPGGTFRNLMYPEYKANRAETPQLVIDALEPLTQMLKAMNIPVLMIPGFEADDVIGSMARRCAASGFEVYMVTPDKDYGQLVDDHIYQYRPGKSGSDNEILGRAEICAKWNISSTAQVIDILTLVGDSADNVPGVQGIGPVGAAKLLGKYGTVEGIYEHLSELSARQQEQFRSAQDHIGLSKTLVTIKTDIPLDVSDADMALGNIHTAGAEDFFNKYEFPSLKRLLDGFGDASGQTASAGGERIAFSGQAQSPALRKSPAILADASISIDELRRELHSGARVSLAGTPDNLYLGCAKGVASGAASQLRDILEDASVEKIGCELKSLMNSLRRECGIGLKGHLKDVSLMHYLLNPERHHDLAALSESCLGLSLGESKEAEPSLFGGEDEDAYAVRSRETAVIFALESVLTKELRTVDNLEKLYNDIEEPLIGVLSGMETAGVKIDPSALRDFADGLRKDMLSREREIREIAEDPDLNVSSPRQVGTLIFEKLKLDPSAKKPRNGSWPTDEQTLQNLSDRSPVIGAILDYRGLKKLLSTYIDPIPGYISPLDGRVHTTFNQALTSTGRLSSSSPNLQNIPVRTEQGREIRKAFVAGDSRSVIMSADYSQIELRVMAHLCGDAHMCEAFNSGQDVHSSMAARIFGIPLEEVTSEQRRMAKTANFGIMYGISAFGLSQRLKCSRTEARQLIDDYFASFPSIQEFINGTLRFARENGYVQTLFGRRRYVPDVNSHNGQIRAYAERNAVNAPIQGTAADIIKLAMISVDRALTEAGLKARMVLQIHDELVLEVPEDEIETVKTLLVSGMEGVVKMNVPLTVECNYGKTWLEAH